jgi:hypothetical protein
MGVPTGVFAEAVMSFGDESERARASERERERKKAGKRGSEKKSIMRDTHVLTSAHNSTQPQHISLIFNLSTTF